MLDESQVREWLEGPVTERLREYLETEKDELIAAKGDAYHPFDAQRTQETLANLNGAEDALDRLGEALTDVDELLSLFELLEEEDEPIGY